MATTSSATFFPSLTAWLVLCLQDVDCEGGVQIAATVALEGFVFDRTPNENETGTVRTRLLPWPRSRF